MYTYTFRLVKLLCLTNIALCFTETEFLTPIDTPNKPQKSEVPSVLRIVKNLEEKIKEQDSSTKKSSCTNDEAFRKESMDCADVQERNPKAKSGVYSIWPQSRISVGPINVYCDMDDDGGAWTVIQRRGDFDSNKEYFYKDWKSYKKGFGDLRKDFWLGNDNIFSLTNERANVIKFYLKDWEGNATYAIYDEFWIEDESRKYTLHVSGYRGTAGDSFTQQNGMPFSTKDADNDRKPESCATTFKGAWWYDNCHKSNLNGYYLKGAHESFANGVDWLAFRGYHYSLKDTVMKIRPKDFRANSFKSSIPK